jgi:O-antigen ligase
MPADQALSLRRNSALALAALAVAAFVCLSLQGPQGLFLYVALWIAALPIILWPLRAALWRELPGALFVFLTFAHVDNLDDLLGLEQHLSWALVLLSFIYLFFRRDDARALLGSPFVVLLGIFYLQQIASAYLLRSPELVTVWQGRTSVFAALVAGAVLTRRPGGRQLFPMLLVLAALVSVPIMCFEITHPYVQLFSISDGGERPGGMFINPNLMGSVLAFAIASVLALRSRGELSRSLAWWSGGACALGILLCGSRGALLAVLVVLGLNTAGRAAQRLERAPIATAALGLGLGLLLLPLLGQGLSVASRELKSLGFENAERLGQVVLAISGSPDELEGDDSGRTDIAASAIQLIGERPLFGFGTGTFSVIDKRGRHSHLQFLEVMGENGLVGLLLYAGVWISLLTMTWRTDPRYRLGCVLLVGAWFVAHFASHNVIVYRYYVLPLAYLCGLPRMDGGLQRVEQCVAPLNATSV